MKKLFMLLVAFAALCVSCSDSDSGDKSKGFPKDKLVKSFSYMLNEGSVSSGETIVQYDSQNRITELKSTGTYTNTNGTHTEPSSFITTYTYETNKIIVHFAGIEEDDSWGGYEVYTLENGLIVKSQDGESLDDLSDYYSGYAYNSANELIRFAGSTVKWSNENIVEIIGSDHSYYEEYDFNLAGVLGLSTLGVGYGSGELDGVLLYSGYFGKKPKNLLKTSSQYESYTYNINSKGILTGIDYDGGSEYGVIQNIVYK